MATAKLNAATNRIGLTLRLLSNLVCVAQDRFSALRSGVQLGVPTNRILSIHSRCYESLSRILPLYYGWVVEQQYGYPHRDRNNRYRGGAPMSHGASAGDHHQTRSSRLGLGIWQHQEVSHHWLY